jgi:hypothetical protein
MDVTAAELEEEGGREDGRAEGKEARFPEKSTTVIGKAPSTGAPSSTCAVRGGVSFVPADAADSVSWMVRLNELVPPIRKPASEGVDQGVEEEDGDC